MMHDKACRRIGAAVALTPRSDLASGRQLMLLFLYGFGGGEISVTEYITQCAELLTN